MTALLRPLSVISQVCGKLVTVRMSNEEKEEQVVQVIVEQEEAPFAFDADPDSSINKLLCLLRSHPNRKTAVAAALKAVERTSQQKAETAEAAAAQPDQLAKEPTEPDTVLAQQLEPAKPPAGSSEAPAESARVPPAKLPAAAQLASSKPKEEEVPVLDLAQLLQGFPKCNHLIETFKTSPNTQNKTPLAVLHEYATRLSLEVSQDAVSHPPLILSFSC